MRKHGSVLILLLVFVGLILVPALVSAQTPVTGACPGAPAPRLVIGGTGRVAQVYSSLRAGLDSNVILKVMYRANNDTFTVVNGPFCGFGPYNWWQVQHMGITGWVTEGTDGVYWVEPVTTTPATVTPAPVTVTPTPIPTALPPLTPVLNVGACPGAPAPRLVIGGMARPAQVYSSLRAALDSNVVLTVMYKASGDTFKVLNGPFCATGPHNWWQVDYKGRVGWVTEGMGSVYWVEPIK